MRDLRSRMNRLRGSEVKEEHNASPQMKEEPYGEQWLELGVTVFENEFGSFLMRTKEYEPSAYHGMHQFLEWKRVATHLERFYPSVAVDPEQVLFLDLETTGLGSGAGNIPFMIGLAYWKMDRFIVQQAFIRHPAEERAMLAYLHRLTATFTHLVSYNGKSFDWPLIQSRFVLHGMKEALWEPYHIDLLHPSRSLWRNTLTSCKLSHIEEMRLGIHRVDDLPGSEAPAIYFEFLANGQPNILRGVYEHNEIDMLSLASLAIRFGHLLSNEDIKQYVQQPTEPEEMVRTGLWLEKMGLTTYSEQLFSLAWHLPAAATNTLLLLAARDKKHGEVERSIAIWQRVLTLRRLMRGKDHIEAAVELAMYYEHKQKDIKLAHYYADIAFEVNQELRDQSHVNRASWKKEQEAILKRIARLEKKLRS